jgi:uncharacterized alkaline shock family protein YloU
MPERPIPGRALVTRRAVEEIVRAAALESYGVTSLCDPDLLSRLLRWLHVRQSGVRVDLRDGIHAELFLTVAYGVPVAEVGRQVESAVRYALRRSLGVELDRLVVHVGGLRYQPARPPVGSGIQVAALQGAGPLLDPEAPGDEAATEVAHPDAAAGPASSGGGG